MGKAAVNCKEKISFNKNEVQVVNKKNNKRKNVYGAIGIFGFLLISAIILIGWNMITSAANERKQQFVKEMMIEAWDAYELHAWGHGELNHTGFIGEKTGLSIVASMSTLWTMGLKEEFERGKKWIETELDLANVDEEFIVFNVFVNYVGGLLSCYALTNDKLFLTKALTIVQLIEPAFNTSTGLPYRKINFKTGMSTTNTSFLSSVGGLKLYFNYLSDASGNPKYREQFEKMQNALREMMKMTNLYFTHFDIERSCKYDYTDLFSATREFYMSLLKFIIESNHLDVQSIEMYREAVDTAAYLYELSPGELVVRDYIAVKYMFYPGCYLGGMLSQSAKAIQRTLILNSSIDRDEVTINGIIQKWHLAEQITEACQQVSVKTKTGLEPNKFTFDETHDVIPTSPFYYFLSPELAESNFILWRLTHKPKYRDKTWQMAQAIHRHCKVYGGGYSGILNINEVPTSKDYRQPAEFLSATLKYLYLTFSDDSVLSLDQWVFNSAGHSLSICGNNIAYPAKHCTF